MTATAAGTSGTRPRARLPRVRPTAVAWGWCGASLGVVAARMVLAVADPASSDASTAPGVPGGGLPLAIFEGLTLGTIAILGAVVASRQPRNPIGWILSAIAFFVGVVILCSHLFWALSLGEAEPGGGALVSAWLVSWAWIPAVIPALGLFPLYFPTGQLPTPRWRWLPWVVASSMVAAFVGEAFAPGPFDETPSVVNPVGAEGGFGTAVDVAGIVGITTMIVAMLGAPISLVARFHRSRDQERQQIKWVATAAVLFLVIFLFPTESLAGVDADFASMLAGLLIVAGAVAVSVLRYRLYDIDVVINRTVVYGSLTATLASVYVGSVLLLQLVLSGLTEGSGLAVAASTLATAALFRPVRSRIQATVDRRFFRSRYDARQTIDLFAARLRDEVDLATVSADLQAVAVETLRPDHVSLWLRTPGPPPRPQAPPTPLPQL